MARGNPYDCLPALTAKDVPEFFDDCFADRGDGFQTAVPMLYGGPGIGKSSIIAQYARTKGYAVLDVRLAQIQPEFLSGVQYVSENKTESVTLQPSIIGRVKALGELTGKPVILLCDEITLAAQDTLSAALEVLLDKCAAGFGLPVGTRVVAAGNRTTDTSSAMVLDPPVRSRLASVILETTADELAEYLAAKLPDSPLRMCVISYLHGSNAKSFFGRNREIGDDAAFFTPRGLEQAIRLASRHVKTLDNLGANHLASLGFCASVGPTVWGAVCAHAVIATSVKPANEVLADVASAAVPTVLEGFVAQMGAISQHISGLTGKERKAAVARVADYLEGAALINRENVRVWAATLSAVTRDMLCSSVKAQRILADCGAAGEALDELAKAARSR